MTPLTTSHNAPRLITTDPVKDEEKIGGRPDMKKQVVEDFEGAEQRDNNQMNSNAEKTVVRKLDWRIVTLLVVLCPFPPFHSLFLNKAKPPASRSSFNPRSFQHWV